MEEKTPDLTYGTNRRWVIKTALLWTLLMVPAQFAQIIGRPDMDFILTLLAAVGFFIIFFQGLLEMTEGVPLSKFRELKLGYPWGLMLGIAAWHLATTMFVFFLLMSAFGPDVVIGGTIGGTPG